LSVRDLAARLGRFRSGPSTPYVGAVTARAAARAVWGLTLPTMLSVAGYGRYQLIATTAAMAASVALLGTPQTVVRHAGRRVPIRLLSAHAAVMALVAIGVAALLIPGMSVPIVTTTLAAAVGVAIAVALLGARAKARLAFRTSLAAELAGAGVLVVAAIAVSTRSFSWQPISAVWVDSTALAVTAAVLLRARATAAPSDTAAPPPTRAVFRDIYAVGALVLLDAVLFRRLEIYFLERSPDGLAGVAVLGLALQIASVAFLVPSALLEAWQPRMAVLASHGGVAFDGEVSRRTAQFAPLMAAVVLGGVAMTVVAVPLIFSHYRAWLGYIVGFVLIRLVSAGAGFYSAVLYAAGRHRALYAPAIASAVVAIAANATFTARLGLRGALISYGAAQLTLAALTVAAFHRMSRRARALETAPHPASA